MGDRLTEKQRTVLEFLARRDLQRDGAATSTMIGQFVFRDDRTKSGRDEWATPALRVLEAKGYVETLGVFGNARTWIATPSGRSVVSQDES